MSNRSESLKEFQYRRRKEELRGHNFQYYSDKLHNELIKKGYKLHQFDGDSTRTMSESIAKSEVVKYRKEKHYSRIICITNRLRIKEYTVYYKYHGLQQ